MEKWKRRASSVLAESSNSFTLPHFHFHFYFPQAHRLASRWSAPYPEDMARANCPDCGGSGWRAVERADGEGRVAVRCECTETDRDSRVLARARIPRRYEHCDFDNFDTDLYEHDGSASLTTSGGSGAWNRSLAQVKLVVQSFVRDYTMGTEAGLLLMGPCGVGKTHLAVAALKELVRRGHIGLFYDYRELLKEIQASYNPDSQTSEMDVLSPVLTAELLLLDDLGSSKPSAWAL